MNALHDLSAEQVIFQKTDRGREEIAKRCHQLPAHLRTLLLQIDGIRNVGELLQALDMLNYELHHFLELTVGGFIADIASDSDTKSLARRAGLLDETVEMTGNTDALLIAEESALDWNTPLPPEEPKTTTTKTGKAKNKKQPKNKEPFYPW